MTTLARLRKLHSTFQQKETSRLFIIACAEVLEERAKKIPWQGMSMPPKYHSLDVAKYELQEAARDFRSVVEGEK